MKSSHTVFNKPLPVTITLEEYPTPESFHHYHAGVDLGETMKVWRVQTADPSEDEEMGWGVVAQGNDFADSPDAEVICGGINTKGPNAVAMGRWGNYFHWGWAAAPGKMTEELKKTFINSIHYITEFDGQTPLVHRVTNNRQSLLDYCLLIDALPGMNAQRYPDDPEKAKEETDKYLEMHLNRTFTPELIEKFGRDGQAYYDYFLENIEYICSDSLFMSRHYIDEDAKAWGISNRDIAILDKAISIIEEREKTLEHDRAMRILTRYTNKQFPWAQQWRTWFEENKDRLFFTDAGGYQFMVNPYME